MKTADIDYLPVWKAGASASERLEELAIIARKHPERFEKFVICHFETRPSKNMRIAILQYGCTLLEQIGMFELGRDQAMEESRK